jgi:hypothetical protein
MHHAVEARRRAVEMWFRRRGLPMVVLDRIGGTALLPRATPAQVFLLLLDPLLTWVTERLEVIDVSSADTPYVLGVLGLSVATVVVPIVVAWFVARAMRRRTDQTRLIVACVVLLLSVLVLPLLQKAFGQLENVGEAIAVDAAQALVLLFFAYVGAGSILAWTLRVAVRQVGRVGSLASRALPLLMIFVMFGFFATETWQIAEKLESGGRRFNLWLVIGFFGLLASLFLIALLRDEGRDVLARHRAAGSKDYSDVLRRTPLDGLVPEDDDAVRNFPLSRREKANLALVVFLAQALQVVFFAFVVFWFFVVFGLLAIDDSVVEAWLGHSPSTSGKLFTLRVPGVSDELIRVSMLLAGFSGMYFAASIATDSTYRKSFFDPLLADVAVSLAARDVYLTLWNGAGTQPSYPEKGPDAGERDLEWQQTE